MKLLFLVALICCCTYSKAQNTETDSLKNALAITDVDSMKVYILESLSYAYLSSFPDSSLHFALEGMQLAEEIGFRKGEATCTNALGNVYFAVGDYPNALQMYLRYIAIKEELKQPTAVAYFNLANVYTEQQDYLHALFYLFKAKQEDEKAKDSAAILYDNYSLGNIYNRMLLEDSALFYLTQSQRLAESLKDKNMQGAIFNSFGGTYLLKKDTSLASTYFHGSIFHAALVNDKEVLSSSHFNLAQIFLKKKMLDSAEYHARHSLKLASEAPFLKQVLETTSLLADLFHTKKRFDSAFHYQSQTIAIKDSLFNVEQVKRVFNLKSDEQKRQHLLETAEIRYRNRIKLYIVVFASVIFLASALVLLKINRQKQKVNAMLQEQKKKVETTLSELKLTQAQLIHAEKMASLGELTAGIAHEIQNPLNFINNFSEVSHELLDEMRVELSNNKKDAAMSIADDVMQNLDKVIHHGKRADSIVKGMLQHSRTTSTAKEPTDINALADEYLRLAFHGLRAKDKSFKATLQTAYDDKIGKIDVIPQDIGRMLLNMFNNAFYTVNEKKKSNPLYNPELSVTTRRTGNIIEIAVKDNGNGIPETVVNKIFQPFFTTKPTGQGTGLGLSLSYDIVKAHGGEIKVISKEGQGSTFVITLNSGEFT